MIKIGTKSSTIENQIERDKKKKIETIKRIRF